MAQLQQIQAAKHVHLVRVFDKLEQTVFAGVPIMIAGGAVRKAFQELDLGRSDIDLFFANNSDFERARQVLGTLTNKIYANSNCIGATLDRSQLNLGFDCTRIQLIKKRIYPGFLEMFNDFDFTICQFGYRDGFFQTTERAVQDLNDKRLEFVNPGQNAETTPNRLYKYLCRGFTPSVEIVDNTLVKGDVTLSPWSITLMSAEEEYDTF